MKKIVLVLLCGVTPWLQADPILTFFFDEYPTIEFARYIMGKMKKPHALAKRSLEGLGNHNRIAGIFSSYYGYINASDTNGQTVFPRKQSKGNVIIAITSKITPIIMFQATVSHWQTVPGTPSAFYMCELKEDDETKLQVWQVSKLAPPENNQIPATESLIIIAKPQNIYLPLGATLTTQDANLMLPTMYVKKGINSTRNALYMLNLSFLFRPIDLLYQREKKRYGTLAPG